MDTSLKLLAGSSDHGKSTPPLSPWGTLDRRLICQQRSHAPVAAEEMLQPAQAVELAYLRGKKTGCLAFAPGPQSAWLLQATIPEGMTHACSRT